MSARSSRIPSRTTTFLLVACAHGLVLWMIWGVDMRAADEVETIASVMFFLPETSRAVQPMSDHGTTRPAPTSTRPPTVNTASVQQQRLLPLPQSADSSTAINLPTAAGAVIDWSMELSAAADSTLKKERQVRDQLGVFTRKFVLEADAGNPGQSANREFRWYQAGTHRIDTRGPIPVLHLSDRCVLVAFIFPACAIGHIEIHGDLFKNMVEVLDEHEAAARPHDVP